MSDRKPKPDQDDKGRFVSGNIGGGRPKGARAKLGEAFLADMQNAWKSRGKEAIEAVIDEKPDQFLKVVASILPKELSLDEETTDALADVILQRRKVLSAT